MIILCVFFFSAEIYAQLGFCQGNSGDPIFVEDFGTGIQDTALPPGTTTYTYANGQPPDGGLYTVTSNTSYFDWFDTDDRTLDDVDGRMLIVNSSFSAGEFYRTTITGLCENTTYEFSSWLLNLAPLNGFCGAGAIPVNVRFEIWDSTDTNLLASGDTGDIFGTVAPTWEQYALVFQTIPSQTSVILKMVNNGVGGCGNDVAIDDIVFKSCGDLITVEDTNSNSFATVCSSDLPFVETITAIPDNTVFSTHFYQWQMSTDGINWSDISGETNASLTLSVTTASFYRAKVAEFQANLSNEDCITLSDVYQVSIVASPDAPISNGDVDFNCDLNEALLQVSVPNGVSVNWYNSSVDGILIAENTNIYVTNVDGIFYAEAIDDLTGCVSLNRTEVFAIIQRPEIPITDGDVGIDCETNEVELLAFVDDNGVIVNWYDAETEGNLLLVNSNTLVVNELGSYFAEAVDQTTGCKSISRSVINVLAELQTGDCIIPQGISPGVSEGLNDSFDLSGFNVTKIEIFNRYGTLVYSKLDYTDEWEGQTNQGELLPVGTYFYSMTYNGGDKHKSGWVYLNY
ncbi:T9SS type B sorting domain-containing protein [Winogradskyella sp.]